ncbi:hypothetical protein ACPA9J_07175 [Pseudomonas aeruginosa]
MNFACEQEAQDFLAANPDIELFELVFIPRRQRRAARQAAAQRRDALAVYRGGRPLPSTILGLTMNGEDVEDSGLVWDVGDIDCRAPLSGSLVRLPWRRDPDGGGAGQHAPERGPARQRRRSAAPPGADHRRAEERGYHPGDGRRAGVLPARP